MSDEKRPARCRREGRSDSSTRVGRCCVCGPRQLIFNPPQTSTLLPEATRETPVEPLTASSQDSPATPSAQNTGAQLLNLSGNCLAIAPVSASATVYMWSFIAAQVCAS